MLITFQFHYFCYHQRGFPFNFIFLILDQNIIHFISNFPHPFINQSLRFLLFRLFSFIVKITLSNPLLQTMQKMTSRRDDIVPHVHRVYHSLSFAYVASSENKCYRYRLLQSCIKCSSFYCYLLLIKSVISLIRNV